MDALAKVRHYAENGNGFAFPDEMKEILARLDAAEEVCRRGDAHRGACCSACDDAVDRWKVLAEPKPEHELIYGSASAALYSCRCGWELPRDVAMSADRIANAFAKHFAEATK